MSSPAAAGPTARGPLTKTQARVYRYMLDHQAEHGRPATVREISDHLGSRAVYGTQQVLELLLTKGWIKALARNTPRRFIALPPVPEPGPRRAGERRMTRD